MLENSVNTNFISEKVAKIRFCHEPLDSEATAFVTGSYNVKVRNFRFNPIPFLTFTLYPGKRY